MPNECAVSCKMVAISAFIRRGLYGAAGKLSYAIAVEAFMLLRRECFE